MFRDTLHLPVETPENPFVALAEIHIIEAFMNRVGYQGVVDKVSAFFTKNLAQPWQTMFKVFNYCLTTRTSGHDQTKINILQLFHDKKEAIQYPRFIKLIVADLMKKFPDIPKRLEKDYHSIKDDVPLVSVYTTGNVLVRGMLIPNAFLTTEIRETNDFKEYETMFMKVTYHFCSPPESKKRKQIAGESSLPRKSLKITIKRKQLVEKDDDDSKNRIEHGSHKDNLEVVYDDDDNEREKKDDEIGSLEIRNEETQTTIPTPLIVPQIAENVTNDLVEANLKPCIVNTIIEDRDAFRLEVPNFVSKEFKAHAPAIIEELFKNHVQSNVIHEALRRKFEKSSTSKTSCREDDFHSHHDEHQDDDAPPKGEKRVKRNKKSKRSESARDSLAKHSKKTPQHMYPNNKVNIKNGMHGKKRMLLMKMRNPNEPPRPLYNKDLFFLKYGNTEENKYILSLHKIHAEEFPEPNLEEKLNRWVRKEFNTFNEDARLSIQHWKDSWHKRVYKQNKKKVRKNLEEYYSNYRITEVVRIVTDQPHGLDFMEQILVMRANDKPDSFSEADFKYLNKNNIEDLYYLCRSKEIDNRKVKLMNSLITFIKSYVIWERVHDFQLGIESYQLKVNLTAPTLTFPGIEEHAPYTIVDEPQMGLIYLNSKDEKRVMYLEEIVKFCDATLKRF
ncbi:hypothetical protein Tco_0855176 [Tanacetum coccineum]